DQAPVLACPEALEFSGCEPDTFCFPIEAYDPENGPLAYNILSENATVIDGQVCYYADQTGSADITIEVTDECLNADTCTVAVNTIINQAPSVALPEGDELFLCEPDQICFGVEYGDPDGETPVITTSYGSFDNQLGQVCFFADTAGTYDIVVTATDSCGAFAADTITYYIGFNQDPYVTLGDDLEVGLCGEVEVCVAADVGDPDGNLIDVSTSLGIYDEVKGEVCFTAVEPGTYEIIVTATDTCEATAVDTAVVTVSPEVPPFVDLGEDLNLSLCEITEICVDVNTVDNLLSLTTTLGVYNEQTGQICFTPEVSGDYQMIVTIVDNCDLTATDTLNISVDLNSAPAVTGLPDTSVYLCEPQAICVPVQVTDIDGNIESITTSLGTYDDGLVCFTPYDSGTFEIVVTAVDSCGLLAADTGYVNVLTDQGVEIVCPNDTSVFTCVLDTFCVPLEGVPEYADVSVQGINTWYDEETGNICFFSECGNVNHIYVTVNTPCNEYKCDFTITVECNHSPLVILPPDSLIIECEPTEICVPVGIADPDDNIVDVTASGGTYNPSNSQVCFTPDSSGAYPIVVTATDECGDTDTDTMLAIFQINTAPTIVYTWSDSIVSTCEPEVCVPIEIDDADGNVTEVSVQGGHYDEEAGEICFEAGTSGSYSVEVIAYDECGLETHYFASVNVEVGDFVYFECSDTTLIADPICEPGEVCVPLTIDGQNFTITTSLGSYVDGQLCFQADTAGVYDIELIGEAECNTDSCTISVLVEIAEEVAITCPGDTAMLFCGPDTVCFDYTVAPLGATVTVDNGYIADGTVCVPVQPGTAEQVVTLMAGTECGADTCSFTVNATFNTPPVIALPADTSMTLCDLEELCFDFTASDIDDNLIEFSANVGSIVDTQLCFTPDAFGSHTLIVTARDECGATGVDTMEVTLVAGGTPVIVCPQSTVYDTLCAADSVCVTVPISPSTADVTILPGGTYDPEIGKLCIYAGETGTYDVMVIAEAPCGVDTCEFTVDVIVAQPAVVTCPGEIDTLLCLTESVTVCYPVTVSGTVDDISVEPAGTYASGEACFEVTEAGTYEIDLIASGLCSADTCTTTLTITADQAPTLHLPDMTGIVYERCPDDTDLICIDGIWAEDIESDVELTMTCGPGQFEFATDDSGRVCFLPDSFGTFEFCFAADDDCNTTTGSFFVEVVEEENCDVCMRLSIDGGACIPVGVQKNVDLLIETDEYIGGFELLISYDASVMAFLDATIEGTEVDGWEYFEYRLNEAACGSACPSGVVRFVGIADQNNGAAHPPFESLNPNGVLIDMQFQVANDQNLGDQFLPINFVWYDSTDNAVSDTTGTELYVDLRIYNPEGFIVWDEDDDVTYPESSRPFGLGTPDDCFGGGKTDPVRCIEFQNGGICVLHPDSLDDRGDINLNGIAYEIADAVVFSNYFVYGLSVFTVNVAGQVAATDVNADGITLSVADLVLLIRVIIGDADPIPKLSPYAEDLIVTSDYEPGMMQVSTNAVGDIGAALFVFELQGDVRIDEPALARGASGMDLDYIIENNELRMLVWNLGTEKILSGEQQILDIPINGEGNLLVKEVEVCDYQGRPYNCRLDMAKLPTAYSLSQNYPNPFNPATTINFNLPAQSDWSLKVFNVTGKLVREFNGSNAAGQHSVVWDGMDNSGRPVASGVYFYRFDASDFSQTKKMILLK
ncbi:T9SS type A sorting domain-containing protein, partial [candidate division GN15 bacterium]|nr:T9SS type A sorting domain-containing protein [candidate division GN15 bacterium]